ncbi:hypothetical protein H112_05942 [Trichophyton rubrum D6]|uniref:Uncharacterized protein n=5 Tax=Trichophyton TaxID=5550 RepID=A0A178ET18_TRIRU|nr:uncharacterized protein TERG_03649 [Trichophyton rubrum CBS 118892]EZF15190.1 hypothetical protein H100_05957 [Trichophyton rubrum MR850]EZF40013.1 hypothetical protein H102_05926 [Trichophyton rubrum CBS 100081]EZF50619.1 hypothetical protein H103_05952 [Trichophyton rubrum CBS 288.86]EZF61072.1 hypothetical protein H104_05939 [Trichophyton rubrum CBS 289.86]EZF71844.1 hypothetical protein H105_05966 [Trichophyton soudanense CBS 452.61]EZF82542.1 hypothetical protein H110_05948 [Trichophy
MGAGLKPKEKDYRLPFHNAIAIFNEKTGRYEPVAPAAKPKKAATTIGAVPQPKPRPTKVQKAAKPAKTALFPNLLLGKDGKLGPKPFVIRKVRLPEPQPPTLAPAKHK